MIESDFKHRITFKECEGLSENIVYCSEPSLEEIVERYYGSHFDKDEAKKYTARYISQICEETSK